MKARVLPFILLIAVVALTVAPAASPRPAGATKTIVTVSASEFKFKLSKTSVPHGVVVFRVVNKGMLPHDFKIGGKKTKLIPSGKSATLTVTLSKGKKPYLCTVSGHATAGMKGTLRVT